MIIYLGLCGLKGWRLTFLAGLLTIGSLPQGRADEARPQSEARDSDPMLAEGAAAVAEIEAAGGRVRRIAQNVDWLEVSFARSTAAVTPEALAAVARLPQVRWLDLQGTDVTDDGLQQVGKMRDLTRLHLERTAVSDAGLAALAELGSLEYLNLYGTQVTNQGLPSLHGLTHLRKLYLWQTNVTLQGMQALQARLPQAEIMAAAPLPVAPQVPLATGRFVRVRLLGEDKILSLAEVEVFSAEDGTPLHSAGQASQSSVDYDGQPGRAIDGRTDSAYDSGSITHTAAEPYPWWQLDLGEEQSVGRIKVWNRADQTGQRLEGAMVELLDEERQVVWAATLTEVSDGSTHEFTPPAPTTPAT